MGELVELVSKEAVEVLVGWMMLLLDPPVDVLDGSDGELVEPPVTDCVAVCVDELCP